MYPTCANYYWGSEQGTKDGCGIKMERYHTATSRGTVYDVIVHPSATTVVATHVRV